MRQFHFICPFCWTMYINMNKHKVLFWIVLIVAICVLFKCYWRVQIMYNSDLYSLYTPKNAFPVIKEKEIEHEYLTNKGFEIAKRKSIVICGLLRDAENKIKEIKKKVESVGALFGNYIILIVENDSSDNTRDVLLKWSKENPRVTILGCGINVSKCSLPKASRKTEGHHVDASRIEKMVRLRNIYLDYIKKHESLRDFDFMAVWDMDTVGSVYMDGVVNTVAQFSRLPNVDAICAYGIYRWGPFKVYYDTYAHIDEGDVFHIDLKSLHDAKKGLLTRYSRGEDPVKVVSCFSGFTMYKIPSIISNKIYYDMTPPSEANLECEHVRLHRKLSGQIYLNPSMINLVLLND